MGVRVEVCAGLWIYLCVLFASLLAAAAAI